MAKKRFTREEIIGKLRHADVLLGRNGIGIDPGVRAKPSRKVAAD
jgi:hypothetical protein